MPAAVRRISRTRSPARTESNCLFQILDLNWRAPKSGFFWYTSRQLKRTISPRANSSRNFSSIENTVTCRRAFVCRRPHTLGVQKTAHSRRAHLLEVTTQRCRCSRFGDGCLAGSDWLLLAGSRRTQWSRRRWRRLPRPWPAHTPWSAPAGRRKLRRLSRAIRRLNTKTKQAEVLVVVVGISGFVRVSEGGDSDAG